LTIGEKIKQFRINKGLNQTQLAKVSGVSRISIGYYERNEQQPGIKQLRLIATALEVSPADIMGWGAFDEVINTDGLTDEVKAIEVFESYLSSIGYTIKCESTGERFITKGKSTAEFNQVEFDELQVKFFELQKKIEELQADNQAIIETRIQKKAKK
jgi:transcriptional regulator with XRE-family HTH domain